MKTKYKIGMIFFLLITSFFLFGCEDTDPIIEPPVIEPTEIENWIGVCEQVEECQPLLVGDVDTELSNEILLRSIKSTFSNMRFTVDDFSIVEDQLEYYLNATQEDRDNLDVIAIIVKTNLLENLPGYIVEVEYDHQYEGYKASVKKDYIDDSFVHYETAEEVEAEALRINYVIQAVMDTAIDNDKFSFEYTELFGEEFLSEHNIMYYVSIDAEPKMDNLELVNMRDTSIVQLIEELYAQEEYTIDASFNYEYDYHQSEFTFTIDLETQSVVEIYEWMEDEIKDQIQYINLLAKDFGIEVTEIDFTQHYTMDAEIGSIHINYNVTDDQYFIDDSLSYHHIPTFDPDEFLTEMTLCEDMSVEIVQDEEDISITLSHNNEVCQHIYASRASAITFVDELLLFVLNYYESGDVIVGYLELDFDLSYTEGDNTTTETFTLIYTKEPLAITRSWEE